MKISIFGLGYVGCVTAACLADDGHSVVGVDVNPQKVEQINAGLSPIVEPGLDELITAVVNVGNLKASLDGHTAVHDTDVSLVCVGTPSHDNGNLELSYIRDVCAEIGTALATKQAYHVVVIRSTVLPCTVEEIVIPVLEQHSGRKSGVDFGVCMNPEFLREGNSIQDYRHPSFIVIGELDHPSGDVVQEIYATIDAPVIRTSIRTAEMVKYVCNTFHALKVVFANEIGNLSKVHGLDGQEVMDIFCQDHQLNISSAYLRPGFAFGGSCLPKDVRALVYRAKERDMESSVINAILPSNRQQIEQAIKMVIKTGQKKVGILGLSFKDSTDDLRESPSVILAETLIGKGYQVRIFDENIQLDRLLGANKQFIERELPHIASLLCASIGQLVSESEVVVLTNGSKAFREVTGLLHEQQTLIDLVGTVKDDEMRRGVYHGICW